MANRAVVRGNQELWEVESSPWAYGWPSLGHYFFKGFVSETSGRQASQAVVEIWN